MFKDNLKKIRKAKNFSQAELADKADVTQAYISYMESGENSPNIKIAKKLANALEVPIENLLEDNEAS